MTMLPVPTPLLSIEEIEATLVVDAMAISAAKVFQTVKKIELGTTMLSKPQQTGDTTERRRLR